MSDKLPIASHGRGGAGNIGADSNEYVDGGIVREGTPSGTYTGGRGGGGNVAHGTDGPSVGHDVVPENAQRDAPEPSDGHGISTGRGGGGNIVGGKEKESIIDKIKHAVSGK